MLSKYYKNFLEFYKHFYELVEEIPFGNSNFQNQFFVIWYEHSNPRVYRAAALYISSKLEALLETYYNLKKQNIDIELLKREIAKLEAEKPENYDLLIEKKKLEIEEKNARLIHLEKLIKDAIVEIESLWPIIAEMWKITRAEFEAAEEEHYRKKMKFELENPNWYIQSLLIMDKRPFEKIINENEWNAKNLELKFKDVEEFIKKVNEELIREQLLKNTLETNETTWQN